MPDVLPSFHSNYFQTCALPITTLFRSGLVMAYQTSSQRSLPPSYSVASGNDELLFIRPSQLNVCMFVETITRRNAGQGLDRDTMQCSWSPRGESTIAFAC